LNPNACAFDPNKQPTQVAAVNPAPLVVSEVNKKLFEAMTSGKEA
jgi:hypothetical protein